MPTRPNKLVQERKINVRLFAGTKGPDKHSITKPPQRQQTRIFIGSLGVLNIYVPECAKCAIYHAALLVSIRPHLYSPKLVAIQQTCIEAMLYALHFVRPSVLYAVLAKNGRKFKYLNRVHGHYYQVLIFSTHSRLNGQMSKSLRFTTFLHEIDILTQIDNRVTDAVATAAERPLSLSFWSHATSPVL